MPPHDGVELAHPVQHRHAQNVTLAAIGVQDVVQVLDVGDRGVHEGAVRGQIGDPIAPRQDESPQTDDQINRRPVRDELIDGREPAPYACDRHNVTQFLQVETHGSPRRFPILLGSLPLLLGSSPILLGTLPILLGMLPTLLVALPTLLVALPTLLGAHPALLGSRPTLLGVYPILLRAHPILLGSYPTFPGGHPTFPGERL